jgi:ATP-dependent phosphofructokinase / diphosphate-dependent phosphofructokinase
LQLTAINARIVTMKKEIVGIVVGGGPAPGINSVISAATIEAINEGKQVVGIVGGFNCLFDGNENAIIPLTIDHVSRVHLRGGSILRTSRGTPDDAKQRFKILMSMLKRAKIKYLISIGGEGSLFVAHWIEKEARGSVNVVHVPKTIDNDVPMPGGLATFGYQTARHIGVQIVENLMEDARTMGRWYFVTTMGRNAGHLALGMGVASGATVTLIPEEFGEEKVKLTRVADILAGSIIKRLAMGRDHGVAILAEGIADRLDPEELVSEQVEKDSMGRVRLSDIPLGRLLRALVRKTLGELGIRVTIVDKSTGYEMRAADPIPYDVEYTRNLGYGAVRFLLKGGTGSMIVVYEGNIKPIPFVEMLEFSDGTIRVRKVDLNSEAYEVARKYMIRLERGDFVRPQLDELAKVTSLGPEEFRKRFGYLVDRTTVSYPLPF